LLYEYGMLNRTSTFPTAVFPGI